jgi:hypothetical protein
MAKKFDFAAEAYVLLDRLGAVEIKEKATFGKRVTLLHTVAGPLHIVVVPGADDNSYQPFVAMQFEWPELAVGKVEHSLNEYSGKWNFHPEKANRAAVEYLEWRLREIMANLGG